MQPGETGKIPVRLSTGNRSGPIKKTITVTTNVPGRDERITLTFQGETWMVVDVKPATASFGRLAPNSTDEASKVQTLTITNNASEDLKIGEIKTTPDVFQTEIKPTKPGKEYELKVKLVGDLPSGSTNGNVTVATGLQEMPMLTIPIRAYVTADVEVMPPKLTLGSNRTGITRRQFYVRNNAKTPLKISDIKVSNPAIKATLEETKTGETFQIAVEIPEDVKMAAAGETVTLQTDNPRFASITVPINEVDYTGRKAPTGGSATQNLGRGPTARSKAKSAATVQKSGAQPISVEPGKAVRPAPTKTAPTAPAAPAAPAAGATPAAPTAPAAEAAPPEKDAKAAESAAAAGNSGSK